MMKVSRILIQQIKEFEGFRPNAYKCPAGVWTIGYGHTFGVKRGDKVTEEEAEELLRKVQACQFVHAHGDQVCPANWKPGAETLKPSLDLVGQL